MSACSPWPVALRRVFVTSRKLWTMLSPLSPSSRSSLFRVCWSRSMFWVIASKMATRLSDEAMGGSLCCTRGVAAIIPCPYALLLRDRRAAAQHILLDLAGGRLRQLVHKAHPLGRLEVGQAVAHKLLQLSLTGRAASLQHHEGVGRLAPLLVGHAHHGGLL